jgi:RNA polymerase sigma-70 factor, ECF subfamily
MHGQETIHYPIIARFLYVHLTDEARLIERARASDKTAISELYRAHVQSIYRYLYLRVNDAHTAEDLTSEVFLRALESLDTFEYRGLPFSAWLFRIARDRLVDHYRRQSRRPDCSALTEDLACDDDEPHEVAVRLQEEAQVRAALGELTEDQRLVLVLRFVEHESLADIGCRLGKTEGAVKSLQHRALAALNRVMEGKA